MNADQPLESPPIYFDLIPENTAEEAGGFSRAAIRRRGFGMAVTLDASVEDGLRIYQKPDLPKLLELLESSPLVVGYNCLFFDLQVLRGLGRCKPRKVCDLMKAYEKNSGKRASIIEVTKRTIGSVPLGGAEEKFSALRRGDEAFAELCLEQTVVAMRQLHEFMIANEWTL